MAHVWPWLSLLPALALASCGDEQPRPAPSVSVTSGGASDGGAGPLLIEPDGGGGPVPLGEPCNGWPQLCARPYDRVTYPVTHAAMANTATFWQHPAQSKNLRTQLDESIRGLMLEVHEHAGSPALCFNDCTDGQAPLVAELARVAGFLNDNPRDVVTLFIDNRVPATDIAAAFAEAKLTRYLFQDEGAWPTLGTLIEADERLVVFVSDATGAAPGFRSLVDNVRATNGSAATARELDCDTPFGSADAPLVLLLQTLAETAEIPGDGAAGAGGASSVTVAWPSSELAASVNRDPFFSERVQFCADVWGQEPTFVGVDFYDQSDVIGVTQRVGGLVP